MLSGCVSPPKKPAALTPGDYEYAKAYLTWLINKQMKAHKVVGLSIALVDDQEIVWAEGFGYARRSDKTAATPQTVYQVGSISKVFTATAVMQLAEAGKIDVDQPLSKYLPQFSIKTRFGDAGPITPRSLMTHHSGLPSDRLQGMFTASPGPFTEVAGLFHQEYAAYPPNLLFSYSNLGFSLLGHLVQQVGGQDFVAHMDTSVLGPMGMTQSSYKVTPGIRDRLSKAYVDGKETDPMGLRDLPAGSLVSSVRDISRLMMMVFGGGQVGGQRIIKPETLAEMLRPQNVGVPLDFDARIGLAWFLGPRGLDYAGPVASHDGGTIGYISTLICLPKHKLGAVVLTNSDTGGMVAGQIVRGALKVMVETKTGTKPPDKKAGQEPRVVSWPAEQLKGYEGHYVTPFGLIEVKRGWGWLHTKLGGTSFRLLPLADDQLLPRYYLLGLIPIRVEAIDGMTFSLADVAGRQILVVHKDGRRALIGEKIERPSVPERWRRLAGKYEITNRAKDFSLVRAMRMRYRDGFIVMALTMQGDQPLVLPIRAVSDTEGIIMGTGRARGDTVFVGSQDGRDTIRYSGYVFRKLSK